MIASWKGVCRVLEREDAQSNFLGVDLVGIANKSAIFKISPGMEGGPSGADDEYGRAPLPFPNIAIVVPYLVSMVSYASLGSIEYLFVASSVQHTTVYVGNYDSRRSRSNNARLSRSVRIYNDGDLYVREPYDDLLAIGELLYEGMSAVRAMLQLINSPQHYIVAEQQRGKTKKLELGKVARMNQRKQYIVLDKEAVKTQYKQANGGTHAPPESHFRRGHWRTLRDERYGDRRGTRTWIRSTTVNGKDISWETHGKIYKVV